MSDILFSRTDLKAEYVSFLEFATYKLLRKSASVFLFHNFLD